MKVIDKKTVFEGRFLRIVDKFLVSGNGQESVWETVERTNVNGRGAVVIIALTPEGELIFEKNWRAPLESYVIQFPAGLTDIAGESEEETARRELLEETGYLAGRLIPVMAVPLAPAILPTSAMHFFAPDVEYVGIKDSKDTEEIEVIKVPLDQVSDFLLNRPEDVELDLRVPGILWIMREKQLI
ncbi:MAG: NUDIX hydrolase [Dehalococcoidia bacterium]|nr:NUDIX hydrolase [Dehalococcoidia bacterium]